MAQQFDAKRLSHAYIISAPTREEGLCEARRLAAAAVCDDPVHAPCGQCRACRKAAANIHPDIITVERLTDDKGKKKREIIVDQVRDMNSDACILPNEASRKVYIIDEADTMNLAAQNAALKLLEEPPAGAVFLLCVTNPLKLLDTVRSRCVEINFAGDADEQDEESIKLASAYLKTVASGDLAALCRWCAAGDAMDIRAASDFCLAVSTLIADILTHRRKNPGLSTGELVRINALMEKCGAYLKVNTGVKHIFGLLAVDSIAGGGK